MRAVLIDDPGKDSSLRIGEAPEPALGEGELRIDVAAFAVNRGDLMQRRGMYPPPPGASELLGLECAGTVSELGSGVTGFALGDRVMALLPGGGYAEQAVAPAACVMPVPERLSLEEAAAVPEVFLTVHLCVFQLAGLPDGGTLLAHGGGSGIGTAAIQLAREVGARVFVTAGSDQKCRRCEALGATRAIDYKKESFAEIVRAETEGAGVDVVLDHIGGAYLDDNLGVLSLGGRLVLIGLMGGAKAEINLGAVVGKRLSVLGSTLRARPVAEKGALIADFQARFGDALATGRIGPTVDRVLAADEVEAAHAAMQASEHFGKIVLRW